LNQPPLIPRRELFGDPSRIQGRISPDGRMLSWLAPRDGVLNIWVAPVDDADAARCVTGETQRGISVHYWAHDSRHLLYPQDRNGDENWNIFATDIDRGETRNLTPLQGVHANIIGLSPERLRTVAVELNDRDARWHDIYEVDIVTGERRLSLRNDGELFGFVLDRQFATRLALRTLPGGDQLVLRNDGGAFTEMQRVPHDDSFGTTYLSFNAAGDTLFALTSIGRDKAALLKIDWATGRQSVLAEHAKADVETVPFDPVTDEADAAGAIHLRREWIALPGAEAAGRDLAFLGRHLGGDIEIVARTDDNSRWLAARTRADDPLRYYLLDRPRQAVRELFSTYPQLAARSLRPMHPLVIRSRDGLELVSYLTLPENAGDAVRPPTPLPMVLLVHGGPWSRQIYGFNPQHQWLANRGYAVLDVNFRGSTGLGKAFLNAGDLEWGGKMHDDLLDAVAWAVSERIADSARVAIMGRSYGGYATLAGLAFTPDVFCCGVEQVGPSNLETLLATSPPYWAAMFEMECRRIGDPRSDAGRALLRERSPLHKAHAIRKPLLIGQGANDVRVKQAESDQIVDAMTANGLPVTYLVYPDEGHGMNRPQNRLSWSAIAEAFLARHLGGRAEPIGDDLAGASVEVRAGIEQIAGLVDTVGARAPGHSA
jgi:dipeptidyl aminopeptidase/acylaminoacyl peptidase